MRLHVANRRVYAPTYSSHTRICAYICTIRVYIYERECRDTYVETSVAFAVGNDFRLRLLRVHVTAVHLSRVLILDGIWTPVGARRAKVLCLFACLYVCTYVYMYIRVCIHVCVCVCVDYRYILCIFIYVYVCLFVYVYKQTHKKKHTRVCLFVYVYKQTNTHTHTQYMHIYIYIYIYICVCVYVVHTHTHTHTDTSQHSPTPRDESHPSLIL
jgi:hypothetical protein